MDACCKIFGRIIYFHLCLIPRLHLAYDYPKMTIRCQVLHFRAVSTRRAYDVPTILQLPTARIFMIIWDKNRKVIVRPLCGYRTVAARCPYDTIKIVRTSCGHRTNIARSLYNFHLNAAETLHCILCCGDALCIMPRLHLPRSSYAKISYGDRCKCNLGI